MRILALDSSSPVASLAFVSTTGESPEILFEEHTPHARSDSSALFHGLEAAVTACGTPEALCVGLGPGSYNGLRAGIAATRGFATALGLPLHAIPSPLALSGPGSGFWAVGDARGGHCWIAGVREGMFLEEPILLPPREAAIHLRRNQDLPILSATLLDGINGIQIATPCAARLAMLAKKNDPLYLTPLTPEPLYLKPPHLTSPKAATPAR
jgi:tRNA threonylcarbamoyl adenosine modification protein YeaZ